MMNSTAKYLSRMAANHRGENRAALLCGVNAIESLESIRSLFNCLVVVAPDSEREKEKRTKKKKREFHSAQKPGKRKSFRQIIREMT